MTQVPPTQAVPQPDTNHNVEVGNVPCGGARDVPQSDCECRDVPQPGGNVNKL